MESTFALILGDGGGQVALIWLLLVAFGLISLLFLFLPEGVRKPRQITEWLASGARQRREDLARKLAEAEEAERYADEIAVVALRAAATAERHRDECQQAQARVDAAWQAYQEADQRLDRARRATAYASPVSIPSQDERAQTLRRTAEAAHRRGDLSGEQLMDALTQRNGWDATLHPVEQEIVLAKATATHRFALYQRSLEEENAAWRASDVAAASVRSLRQEVDAAAAVAEAARALLPAGATADPERERRRVTATA